jgi:hypothetical protein
MFPRGRIVAVVVLCYLSVVLCACASRTRTTPLSSAVDLKGSQKSRGSDPTNRIAAIDPRTGSAKTENSSQVNPSQAPSRATGATSGGTTFEPKGSGVSWRVDSVEFHVPSDTPAVAPRTPEQGQLLSRTDDSEAGGGAWTRVFAILLMTVVVIGGVMALRSRMVT